MSGKVREGAGKHPDDRSRSSARDGEPADHADGGEGEGSRRKYHHGELSAALVEGSLELIAEQGLRGFSVAQVARRIGVSSAAPYRHFADRDSLLAAVAGTVAEQLAERIGAAVREHADPGDRLASAVGSYTEFMIERRAGLHVVFAPGLQDPRHTELHDRTRAMMDHFLRLSFEVVPNAEDGLELMEQLIAQAHGYATIHLDGVFAQHRYSAELVVRKSVYAARVVIAERARRYEESAGA